MKSGDGGQTWSMSGGAGTKISCPSVLVCFVVNNVVLETTTNGGGAWFALPGLRGVAISCPSVSICYVVQDHGNVLVTTDGGTTWSAGSISAAIPAGAQWALSCSTTVTCLAAENDYVSNGETFQTKDGGSTWQPTGAAGQNAAWCASAASCWTVGGGPDSSDFAWTRDGGSSWWTADSPTDLGQDLTAVSCAPPAVACFATGGGGAIIGDIAPKIADPPAGISAVPGNGSATVTWSAPWVDGRSPITQYVITPYANGVALAPIKTGTAVPSYQVGGLINGVAYQFTVAAENAAGDSAASSRSNTATPNVLPAQPGTPVASAGNGQATLAWTAPVPNGGSMVTQYVVTAYPTNGTLPLRNTTGSAPTTYTFTGLHNGVTYTFTVAGQNDAGTGPESMPSNAVTPGGTTSSGAAGTINGFDYGEMQSATVGATGCGVNADFEPQVTISRDGTVYVASERGLAHGSDVWRAPGGTGGPSASACAPTYAGQPNAAAGAGDAGGDVAIATGSAPASGGTYPVYVASLNGGSISVAHSTDGGQTFVNVPVQAGLPDDDREWIAAFGASSSLLTYHDASGNIDVLRSDDGGIGYVQVAQAIPTTDYRATDNELGTLVIDHRTSGGVVSAPGGLPGFWAYQPFVAPSSSGLVAKNELFVSTSSDGGFTWSIHSVACSMGSTDLDHSFPALSVDPSGTLWAAWSDDTNVYTALSSDHGTTWTCSAAVSTTTIQAIQPTLIATSAGVDLAFYATPTLDETWSVYFAQNLSGTSSGWGTPLQLTTVHSGLVCEDGSACRGVNRQLYEDFGIDVDAAGWAHIAYSHDGPDSGCTADLGCQGTYTGYMVQTSGTGVGYRN